MKEQRHNYLWGLSPGNIITLGLVLISVIGTAAVAQYKISDNTSHITEMKKDRRTQERKLGQVQQDIAVIKAVVLRIERQR